MDSKDRTKSWGEIFELTNHTIIAITREQMHQFAGNMLQVKNNKDEKVLIMSQTAFNSLCKEQNKCWKLMLHYCRLPCQLLKK